MPHCGTRLSWFERCEASVRFGNTKIFGNVGIGPRFCRCVLYVPLAIQNCSHLQTSSPMQDTEPKNAVTFEHHLKTFALPTPGSAAGQTTCNTSPPCLYMEESCSYFCSSAHTHWSSLFYLLTHLLPLPSQLLQDLLLPHHCSPFQLYFISRRLPCCQASFGAV